MDMFYILCELMLQTVNETIYIGIVSDEMPK